jgi:hypothetical protein
MQMNKIGLLLLLSLPLIIFAPENKTKNNSTKIGTGLLGLFVGNRLQKATIQAYQPLLPLWYKSGSLGALGLLALGTAGNFYVAKKLVGDYKNHVDTDYRLLGLLATGLTATSGLSLSILKDNNKMINLLNMHLSPHQLRNLKGGVIGGGALAAGSGAYTLWNGLKRAPYYFME